MSFPQYGSYRDSGIDWLGEVPSHWSVKRLRFVADINPSKREVSDYPPDFQVSFLPMEAIGDDGTIDLKDRRALSEVQAGYTFFRDGDVAFAKITPCFENGKGALLRGLQGGVGFGTTELIVARPKRNECIAEFLHWLFVSTSFRKRGEASMYGAGGQKRVPDDFVRNFETAFPPLNEQAGIAAFLNRETGKIGALIEEQKRLIALLKEKRQAVISHAVTKGLNPDAPMKASGVEWLGEVPAHWKVMRLSMIAMLQTGPFGSQLHSEDYIEGGIPVINPSNLKDGAIIPDWGNSVDNELADALGHHRLKLYDIVFGRRGEMGRCALVTEEAQGWLCGTGCLKLTLLQPDLAGFVGTYLRTPTVSSYLQLVSVGSTMDNLNTSILGRIPIPVPPTDEAVEIVSNLGEQIQELDDLAEEAEQGIRLLQERRSALISAAVDGKIDVRGLVPDQAEAA